MRDAGNAPRAQVRGVKQKVMTRHMRADEAVRIKYDSKFAQSANYWKNSIGMNKCIDSIDIINQKKDYEDRIQAWQDTCGFLKGQLDFGKMRRFYIQRFNVSKNLMYFNETFRRTSELVTRAQNLNRIEVMGPKSSPKKQYIVFKDNSEEWDEALDKEVLGTLLKNYREHADAKYLPAFYKVIDRKFGGDCQAYADYLYKKSMLMKSGKKLYVDRKSTRLNSSHANISYAVFCLKKKTTN